MSKALASAAAVHCHLLGQLCSQADLPFDRPSTISVSATPASMQVYSRQCGYLHRAPVAAGQSGRLRVGGAAAPPLTLIQRDLCHIARGFRRAVRNISGNDSPHATNPHRACRVVAALPGARFLVMPVGPEVCYGTGVVVSAACGTELRQDPEASRDLAIFFSLQHTVRWPNF